MDFTCFLQILKEGEVTSIYLQIQMKACLRTFQMVAQVPGNQCFRLPAQVVYFPGMLHVLCRICKAPAFIMIGLR